MNHACRGLPRPVARGTLRRSVLAVLAALAVAGAGAAQAQPGDAAGSLWGTASVDSLAATAAYVGIAQCVECHGPKKQENGLRLDHGAAILHGGDPR